MKSLIAKGIFPRLAEISSRNRMITIAVYAGVVGV